jgi:hypothetical protein
MECKGRTIALLAAFEIGEKPSDVGQKKVADLGLLLDRGVDLGKRVL